MTIGYYRSLTVGAAVVVSGPHAGYTWRFKLSDATLKSVANGGRLRSDGRDVVFGSSAGLTTLYTYEQVFYDAVNGVLVVDVKIPSLANSLVLYVGYADNTITTDRSAGSTNGILAWDTTKYACVVQGGSLIDSTGQFAGFTAIASPGTGTGPNGEAAWSFNGSTQYLQHSAGVPYSTYPLTLIALHKPTSLVGATIVGMQREAGGTASNLDTQATGALRSAVIGDLATTSTFPLDTTHWHLSAARMISSSATANNNIAQAHDESAGVGTPVISPAVSTAYTNGGALDHASIGARRLAAGTGSNFYPGLIARATWMIGDPGQGFVQTVRNSQVASASFATLGAEQVYSAPSNPPVVVIDTPATGGSIVYGTLPNFSGHATPDTGRTINGATVVWRYNGTAFNPLTDYLPVGVNLSITLEVQDDTANLGTSSAITVSVTSYPLAVHDSHYPELVTHATDMADVWVAAPSGTVVTATKSTGSGTMTTRTATADGTGYAKFLAGTGNALKITLASASASVLHTITFTATNCTQVVAGPIWPAEPVATVLANVASNSAAQYTKFSVRDGVQGYTIPYELVVPRTAATFGGTPRGCHISLTGSGTGTLAGTFDNTALGTNPTSQMVTSNSGRTTGVPNYGTSVTTNAGDASVVSEFMLWPQVRNTGGDWKNAMMRTLPRALDWAARRYAIDIDSVTGTSRVVPMGYSGGGQFMMSAAYWYRKNNYRTLLAGFVMIDVNLAPSTVLDPTTGVMVPYLPDGAMQNDCDAEWAATCTDLPVCHNHGGKSSYGQTSVPNSSWWGVADEQVTPFWIGSGAGIINNLLPFYYRDGGGVTQKIASKGLVIDIGSGHTVVGDRWGAIVYYVDLTSPNLGNGVANSCTTFAFVDASGAGYASRNAAYAAAVAAISVPAGSVYGGMVVFQAPSAGWTSGTTFLSGNVQGNVNEYAAFGPTTAAVTAFTSYGSLGFAAPGAAVGDTAKVVPPLTSVPIVPSGGRTVAANQWAAMPVLVDASGIYAGNPTWTADCASETAAMKACALLTLPAGTRLLSVLTLKASGTGTLIGTGTPANWNIRPTLGVGGNLRKLGVTIVETTGTTNSGTTNQTTAVSTDLHVYCVAGDEDAHTGCDHNGMAFYEDITNTQLRQWMNARSLAAVTTPAPTSGGGSRRRRRWALERLVG